jgi:hypothetical protein
MRDIELPPFAPMLLESTRAIGYSLDAAISDIIDNSISANAKRISIYYWSSVDPYIAVLDDGFGMDSKRLTDSMRYGCTDPTNVRDSGDMGRYGLGMKTASLSQCRCLTVISKQGVTMEARQWNLDHIKQTGKWSLSVLDESEYLKMPAVKQLLSQKNGTLVIWQKLDRVFSGSIDPETQMTDKMDGVRNHLSLVFHRFLRGGDSEHKIELLMNEDIVNGFDPFFSTKSRIMMDEERIEIPQYSSIVTVQPYILPHPDKMTQLEIEKYGGQDGFRSMQGFYIYRNKRLLIWGTWFRMTKMDDSSKLARIKIDIPNSLDDLWTLDVKKSTAIPPEIVKTRLRQIIKTIVDSSKKTYSFRARQETKDGISHIWNVLETRDGIKYELNSNHPIYEKLSEMIDDSAKRLLDEYAYSISANFPINRLHNDIFNEKKIVKESGDSEFENIKQQLEILLIKAESHEEIKMIVDKLLTSEPFCNFSERIKIYLEEINEKIIS